MVRLAAEPGKGAVSQNYTQKDRGLMGSGRLPLAAAFVEIPGCQKQLLL